jgi:hypothetical protein
MSHGTKHRVSNPMIVVVLFSERAKPRLLMEKIEQR